MSATIIGAPGRGGKGAARGFGRVFPPFGKKRAVPYRPTRARAASSARYMTVVKSTTMR